MSIHNVLIESGYQDTSESFLASHQFSLAEFEAMFTVSFGAVDFQDLHISSGCLEHLDILIANPFFPVKFLKKIIQGGAKGRWYNDPSDEKHFFSKTFQLARLAIDALESQYSHSLLKDV
jgi:hypothetical protein